MIFHKSSFNWSWICGINLFLTSESKSWFIPNQWAHRASAIHPNKTYSFLSSFLFSFRPYKAGKSNNSVLIKCTKSHQDLALAASKSSTGCIFSPNSSTHKDLQICPREANHFLIPTEKKMHLYVLQEFFPHSFQDWSQDLNFFFLSFYFFFLGERGWLFDEWSIRFASCSASQNTLPVHS